MVGRVEQAEPAHGDQAAHEHEKLGTGAEDGAQEAFELGETEHVGADVLPGDVVLDLAFLVTLLFRRLDFSPKYLGLIQKMRTLVSEGLRLKYISQMQICLSLG